VPPPPDDARAPTEGPESDKAEQAASDTTRDVGSRPSIGAVRRRQQAEAKTAEPPSTAGPAPEPVSPEPEPTAQVASASRSIAEPIDRDTLTEAWGDGILQSLPARAKARFASGRFVAVDEQGAHFALPHAAHRDQCAEQLSIVESALERHFGTKVKLVLDIDDEAASPPVRGTGSRRDIATRASSGGREDPGDVEEVHDLDPSELVDEEVDDQEGGEDQASAAQARLMQAFPGASEVVG
jgi:hypothetical protein